MKSTKCAHNHWLKPIFCALWGTILMSSTCQGQTFTVDFSQHSGPPLVKTKFGVYQTPLTTLPRLLNSIPLLNEINVRDFRYEMGWGKPDTLAYSQISGSAESPRIDFSMIDALVGRLRANQIKPLLAMSYCPDPLQSRTEWARWKDMPSNLATWQDINRQYAARLKNSDAITAPYYEIWNEPDMPEPVGKMFFNGGPQEYASLYQHGSQGLMAGDAEALVGGPAAAWNLAYLAPILSQRMDFASVHGYDNYASQIAAMRQALAKRPDLPIFLTEYASFSDLPPNGPQSRFQGAMRFFRDVKGLLNRTDVTKVYWAQWLDAGEAPGMGLITWDGHRKALFNAFKIYGLMPVDRNSVSPDGAQGIDALASSNEHEAGIVLCNTSATDRRVNVHLNHLPFTHGELQLFRIDKQNASYLDNPSSEDLYPLQISSFDSKSAPSWQGTIPGESVVYLRAIDAGKRTQVSVPVPGTYVRSYNWFPDRNSDAYADFDPRTWTARVGTGSADLGTAQIGNVLDLSTSHLRIKALHSSHLAKMSRNSLFGIRLDFQATNGQYTRSTLFHNGLYDANRDAVLPWGKGGAIPDHIFTRSGMDTGKAFSINLARLAPPDWNGHRILLTLILQDAGRDAWARVQLSGA